MQQVRVAETFTLFDMGKQRTQIRYSDDGDFSGLKASIQLDTGYLGKLTVSIVASPYAKARYSVLTPFEYDQGYPLDQDDLKPLSRAAKINKIQQERNERLQGLYLFVFVAPNDILSNGTLKTFLQMDSGEEVKKIEHLLQQLFLTVKFPQGASFTAQATLNRQTPLLLFQTFFPSDTGPLPQLKQPSNEEETPLQATQAQEARKSEGYDLLLPFDLQKLQTIQATFLVLPNLDR